MKYFIRCALVCFMVFLGTSSVSYCSDSSEEELGLFNTSSSSRNLSLSEESIIKFESGSTRGLVEIDPRYLDELKGWAIISQMALIMTGGMASLSLFLADDSDVATHMIMGSLFFGVCIASCFSLYLYNREVKAYEPNDRFARACNQ